jgi:hypothetical protein
MRLLHKMSVEGPEEAKEHSIFRSELLHPDEHHSLPVKETIDNRKFFFITVEVIKIDFDFLNHFDF